MMNQTVELEKARYSAGYGSLSHVPVMFSRFCLHGVAYCIR